MFPNPAKESFTIKSSIDNLATQLDVFDLTGKLLISKKLENVIENTFATNSLLKGVYLVTIATANGTSYTEKLVIE